MNIVFPISQTSTVLSRRIILSLVIRLSWIPVEPEPLKQTSSDTVIIIFFKKRYVYIRVRSSRVLQWRLLDLMQCQDQVLDQFIMGQFSVSAIKSDQEQPFQMYKTTQFVGSQGKLNTDTVAISNQITFNWWFCNIKTSK